MACPYNFFFPESRSSYESKNIIPGLFRGTFFCFYLFCCCVYSCICPPPFFSLFSLIEVNQLGGEAATDLLSPYGGKPKKNVTTKKRFRKGREGKQ